MKVQVSVALHAPICLWILLSVEGLTFSLNGVTIPNSNMARISVTDFTVSTRNSDGLECRSELTEREIPQYTAGFLVADGDSPVQTGVGPVILPYGPTERGWDTRRVVSGNHRFHYLRRRQASSEEGYYNCHMPLDLNSPAGLYILYPISSVTATIEAVVGTDSFRVRCTSTGGRALDMTVSGPRGFTADISSRIEPVGNRRWLGSDQYTATTDLISGGEDGDEYECNVTSSTSTTGSVILRVLNPSLQLTSPTSVRVSWTAPPEVLVNEYTVLYRLANGERYKTEVVPSDSTSIEISGLTNTETYTFSVAGTTSLPNVILRMSEEMTITISVLVGLEATQYSVSESGEVVDVCVIATGKDPHCPYGLPFQVHLSTADKSAVSPADYGEVSVTLSFEECEERQCVGISVVDDLINEPVETLSLSLTANPELHLTLHTQTSEVAILDDDERPESVVISAVSGTAVDISWSGSTYLSTSLHYTTYCTSSRAEMSQYGRVLLPGVNSASVTIQDDITLDFQYQHIFTLHYITSNRIPPVVTTTNFSFDKMYFQVQFGPINYCLDWGREKGGQLERELTSYLVHIIRSNCSDCKLTPSFLRRGLFLCHGNPTRATYRSTLINPILTNQNATRLVGIIQSWVSTCPSLILDGLLVRVSGECPTAISSLDEGECESGVSGDPGLGQRITQTLHTCALRNLGAEICKL